MNIGRRIDSSRNPINDAKAVLKEARLLRLSSISRERGHAKKKVLPLKERRSSESSASSCTSTCSFNTSMNSFPIFAFAGIKDKNSCSHDLPNDVSDIVRELKQIKQNIIKDMEVTKDMDIHLNSRIQSFMEACNLVLNQFDGQSKYEIDLYSKNNVDDTRKKTLPRRESSFPTKYQRERSSSSASANSSVRFDLSQNEIFG